MDKKSEEKDLQEKYMQYNFYKQQAQGLLQEISLLNQTTQNISTAREVLSNIESAKDKSEILVPVGGNTFLKAKLEDTENVLIGIGADVVLKKSMPEAISTIDEQLENLKNTGEKFSNQMQDLEKKMRVLEPEIQKMMLEARKEQTK